MKRTRHDTIRDLIQKNDIETQEELAEQLRLAGFEVTQATVSRDIRELRLLKTSAGAGRQKYVFLPQNDSYLGEKYRRILQDGFISVEAAQNILVVKTVAGMAMAVAAAIDALKLNGVVGSIAGDDTIMIAVRTIEDTVPVMDEISKISSDKDR
jgi:transcriptional regulator of arginine metabolism